MTDFIVRIPNWAKFNPRSDRANHTWLRLENSFFSDQNIIALTDSQKILYLFVICEMSKKNKDTVVLRTDYIVMFTKTKKLAILKNLQALQKLGMVELLDADARVLTPPNGVTTPHYERTDKQTNEHDIYSFDFLKIWEQYPRKDGKKASFAVYEKQIVDAADLHALEIAVGKYSRQIERNKTEPQFIKLFRTFLNDHWREWVDRDEPLVKKEVRLTLADLDALSKSGGRSHQ